MRVPTVLLVGVLAAACHRQPRRAEPVAAPAPDAAPPPARVVCAPVQGPTKVAAATSTNEVETDDGSAVLKFTTSNEGATSVELTGAGGPTRTEKLPNGVYNPGLVFRGANVIGFGRSVSASMGGEGYVAWATSKPRALFVRPVHDVERSGSRVAFNDKCKMHVLDLATGAVRVAPVRACSWFRLRGDGILVGREETMNGMVTSIEFSGPALALDTGKALPGVACEALVGGTCIRLGTRRDIPNDDPAGPASEPHTTLPFDVRTASGEHVHGEASIPHPSLSPDYAVLWRDAAGKTFGIVATRIDGKVGSQLVLVDESKVSVLSLSEEQWTDQRRIPQLRDFVPSSTNPEDVDALLRERRKVLAVSASDRVRFMEYPAAASAQIPCTAPPP